MTAHPLLLAAWLGCATPAPLDPDPWFGEDKFKHFFASFVVTSIAASGSRLIGLEPPQSAATGAVAGAMTGLYKEIDDVRRGGPFSARDLVWDFAGAGAGAALTAAAR